LRVRAVTAFRALRVYPREKIATPRIRIRIGGFVLACRALQPLVHHDSRSKRVRKRRRNNSTEDKVEDVRNARAGKFIADEQVRKHARK